jgi:hypothetical protein
MTLDLVWRGALIAVLSVALATPVRGESLQTAGDQIVAGIVVVSAAIAVGVTLLILHYKHKKSAITGCVRSGTAGTSVTDEKDQRVYALTGDPVGVKVGDRMTFEGKRKSSGQALVFDAQKMTRDFGACQL